MCARLFLLALPSIYGVDRMLSPSFELLDVGLRAAAIGQILLLCALIIRAPFDLAKTALSALAACATGYLLLTAPVADVHYQYLRGPLLLLTDGFAYALLLATLVYFCDGFSPARWPIAAKCALGLYTLWMIYFFVINQGVGWFHDVNHLLSLAMLGLVVFYALRGLKDDLLDNRRQLRIYAALAVSAFCIYLVCAQLGPDALRKHWLFNLANAAIILLGINIFALTYLRSLLTQAKFFQGAMPTRDSDLGSDQGPLLKALNQFIERREYAQPNLTITALAGQLETQEYQLRRLINRELGYRNFSDFLNEHRLSAAAERLKGPTPPITTIAYELGYGSIGPFNRAFKARFGCTPGDYRRRFQNRP